MTNSNIVSIKHFAAYNQVVEDYKSLLIYESELHLYSNEKTKSNYQRIKLEIIFLLNRIIENKTILEENSKEDHEYLNKLKREEV